jgi:steroid 5-alpha reductase family enzyme
MQDLAHLIINDFLISAACFAVLWLLSIALKDPSFIDAWWALGVVVIAWATYFQLTAPNPNALAIAALASAWGLRLGLYLLWRWLKHGRDRRYAKIIDGARAKRGWNFATASLLVVFGPQMLLQFLLALPVIVGQAGPEASLGWLANLGAALAMFGIVYEAIADAQLAHFKSLEGNSGKLMDRGLWRYSRHPNYFGEICVWWGLYFVACDSLFGPWTVVSPILLTFLLTRVSGAPTTEPHLKKTRPEYEAYKARTSAFIPQPPRR